MMLSTKIKVTDIKYKYSKDEFWKELAIGDILQLSHEFYRLGRYGGRLETPRYTLTNLRNNLKFEKTVNILYNTIQQKISYEIQN